MKVNGKMIKRMEKAGFIEKKPDRLDARIIRLYPTEKAKIAPVKIQEQMDSLEDILAKDMTRKEILTLSDLLDKAINNMTKGCDKCD